MAEELRDVTLVEYSSAIARIFAEEDAKKAGAEVFEPEDASSFVLHDISPAVGRYLKNITLDGRRELLVQNKDNDELIRDPETGRYEWVPKAPDELTDLAVRITPLEDGQYGLAIMRVGRYNKCQHPDKETIYAQLEVVPAMTEEDPDSPPFVCGILKRQFPDMPDGPLQFTYQGFYVPAQINRQSFAERQMWFAQANLEGDYPRIERLLERFAA